ncbi:hypothetical protein DSO57_1024728 [Entomophthora muscae]|uniref:Uncharacterized protein n=2 Tax=Entomophthora muscae TaxID=34485 RepID=A0ACC2TEM5_9FUNG|nr:hypothetical protein DSO57_1024727 [Entomophthora muscae]KAJ9072693.1 hypothetical protein DSO57_1024728 [Entomophthora muscae]
MFSKPTHCCCFLSLRTGSLILAIWLTIVSIYDACTKADTLSGSTVATKTVSMLIPILLAIASVVFLYGTIKRKAKLVSMFSVFLIIHTIIKIIGAILVIVYIVTKRDQICPSNSGINCGASIARKVILETFPTIIELIFFFHFYYVVKTYAYSLNNEPNPNPDSA